MELLWLNGMPRSGTSWLSQIFDSHPDVNFKLSPLFSYAFKNEVGIDSTREQWLDFFSRVAKSEDEFVNQTYRRTTGEYPIFKNKNLEFTHLVIKDTRYHNLTQRMLEILPELKFIHIVRNPCGAINSWINAPKEFPMEANVADEWKTGACRKTGKEEFWGFDDWKYLTRMYIDLSRHYEERIYIIQYEELVHKPEEVSKSMFDFAGLSMTQQTMDFLMASHQINVDNEYAVFKHRNVKDKWKTTLDAGIIEEITQDIQNTDLSRFLI